MYSSIASRRTTSDWRLLLILAFDAVSNIFGAATAARIPITRTTTTSSISVKPRRARLRFGEFIVTFLEIALLA
ncbi:hypothetical protein AYO47_09800 [Planctomyces sp. SCGC AG-212-M04]|nr:hypothetical protein AYO47_09800 [Planctomyces sp. SCGC AG-212-M04]